MNMWYTHTVGYMRWGCPHCELAFSLSLDQWPLDNHQTIHSISSFGILLPYICLPSILGVSFICFLNLFPFLVVWTTASCAALLWFFYCFFQAIWSPFTWLLKMQLRTGGWMTSNFTSLYNFGIVPCFFYIWEQPSKLLETFNGTVHWSFSFIHVTCVNLQIPQCQTYMCLHTFSSVKSIYVYLIAFTMLIIGVFVYF